MPNTLIGVPMTEVRPDSSAELKGRILIVDDLPPNRRLLERQCRFLGFEADVAPDAAAGISMAVAHSHALILLDCQMQEASGRDVATQIRAREAAEGRPRVPIVAVSTGDEFPGEAAALIDAALTKPVEIDDLRAAFASVGHDSGDSVLESSRIGEILRLCQSDAARLTDMIGAFGGVASATVQSMRRAGALRDSETMADMARALSGAAAMVGAVRVVRCCEEIERSARSAVKGWEAPSVEPLCDEIDAALAALGPLIK